jgi:hypothetical protein
MNFSNFLKRVALQLLIWFLQTDVGRVCLLGSFLIVIGLVLKQTITDWLRGRASKAEVALDESSTVTNDENELCGRGAGARKARIAGVKGLATVGRWSKRLRMEGKKK